MLLCVVVMCCYVLLCVVVMCCYVRLLLSRYPTRNIVITHVQGQWVQFDMNHKNFATANSIMGWYMTNLVGWVSSPAILTYLISPQGWKNVSTCSAVS